MLVAKYLLYKLSNGFFSPFPNTFIQKIELSLCLHSTIHSDLLSLLFFLIAWIFHITPLLIFVIILVLT